VIKNRKKRWSQMARKIRCERCGKYFIGHGNAKYCKDCKKIKKREWDRASKRRERGTYMKEKVKVLNKNEAHIIAETQNVCPECGGRVYADENYEQVCSQCGLVVDNLVLAFNPRDMWSTHGDLANIDETLGTSVIGSHMARDKNGNPDFEEEFKKLEKEITWHSRKVSKK
jgi:hypothetical protein